MELIHKTDNGKIVHGDNIEIMKKIKENSIDSCISDFPYDLSFMGKTWDTTGNFYEWCKLRATELYRIMKSGGYVCIFGHPKTNHRMKSAFEDVGFNIVEEIDWVYGTGFPKNQDIGKLFDKKSGVERKVVGVDKSKLRPNRKSQDERAERVLDGATITEPSSDLAKQWNGWKTSGLKPAHEPVTIFQKPLEGNYINNININGCGAMNIDVCRIPFQNKEDLNIVKAKCNFTENSKSIGFGTTSSLYGTGITPLDQARDCVNETGRFPANMIFDSSMGEILDSQSGVSKSTGGSGIKSHGGQGDNGIYGQYDKENAVISNLGGLGDVGGASRYFLNIDADDFVPFYYCPKASKKEKGEGNNHITVKPKELIKWLIKLVTPINGRTIDITAGSCTHALSCEELNMEGYNLQYINIEIMNTDIDTYCNIGKTRIENLLHISNINSVVNESIQE
jgi:site-specific DNA-methyltransferase (adenine-specific)